MNTHPPSGRFHAALFLLLLLFFLCSPVRAQEPVAVPAPVSWTSIYDLPEGVTFEELQQDFRSYWRGREIGKGKGYKPFKRWEAYMAPRIFPSNDMRVTNSTYFNFLNWEKQQGNVGVRKSFAGNWTPLGPFTKATGEDTGVGRLNMVRFDPSNSQIMYVGAADGGLWKSTNGGTSWTTNTDFLGVIGVADLAIDPTDPSRMFLATGDVESDRRSIGVLRSTNGGSSWLSTGLSWTALDDFSIRKLLMHPGDPDILLAATNRGVFRTTNGGTSWSVSSTTANFKDMEFKPGEPSTVYATSNEMWKSTDNGVNWTKITAGVPGSDVVRMSLAVTPAEPNSVYLMAGKASNGGLLGIYKSTDSGANFTTRFEPDYSGATALGTPGNPNILGNEADGSDAAGQSFYTLALAAHPTDPNFLLAGGVSQWASFDGGFTWEISSFWAPDPDFEFVHADTHEILFSADGSKAYSSHDGGLAVFTDGAGTWTDLSNNLNISQQNILGMSASSPNKIAVGLQDIGTILNTAPSTWQVIGGGDGEYCFIDYSNDNIIVETGTNGSHAISFDGGGSFTDIVDGLPTDAESGEVEFQSPIHQDPMVSQPLLRRRTQGPVPHRRSGDELDGSGPSLPGRREQHPRVQDRAQQQPGHLCDQRIQHFQVYRRGYELGLPARTERFGLHQPNRHLERQPEPRVGHLLGLQREQQGLQDGGRRRQLDQPVGRAAQLALQHRRFPEWLGRTGVRRRGHRSLPPGQRRLVVDPLLRCPAPLQRSGPEDLLPDDATPGRHLRSRHLAIGPGPVRPSRGTAVLHGPDDRENEPAFLGVRFGNRPLLLRGRAQ